MDKNTKALKLEDLSMQGGIITATSQTPGLRIGTKITLTIDKNTKADCTVIKKVGKNIKARVTKVYVKKESKKKEIMELQAAIPASQRG